MTSKLEFAQNYFSPSPDNNGSSEGGLNIIEFTNTLKRNIPIISGCTFAFAFLALLKIFTSPPNYISGFELLSEPVNIETKVTASDEESRKTREEITDVDLDEIQLKILQSPKLLLRVIEKVQDKYPGLNYGELVDGLTIDIISSKNEDQNVLKVVYIAANKQQVEDVTNVLYKTYQSYSVEKRQSGVKRGIAFLDRQIPEINNQSQTIQTKIAELRSRFNFSDPNSSLEQITARINELESRRAENDLKLKGLKLTLSNLDRELSTELRTTETSHNTARYTSLLERLKDIDLEIGQQSTVFSERSEILKALRLEREQLITQITDAKVDIRLNIAGQIKALENRQQNLSVLTDELKVQLRQWSQISGEFKTLQNQLNRANNKLNEFNTQKDALQIDAAQQESPWQLLTPVGEAATNDVGAVNLLLLGSTLGLLVGVGAATLRESQKNIIYSSAKVEKITRLPILAALPYNPAAKNSHLAKAITASKDKESRQLSNIKQKQFKSNFAFSTPSLEAFRSFAANLGLLNFTTNSKIFDADSDRQIKSIAVTSAIPREGKSTVALNLARAAASAGKNILIVDSDFRSSKRLTNNLGFESKLGLKNILKQDEIYSPFKYIQKLSQEENLFILTSGNDPLAENSLEENPGQLLASAKMYSLMEDLEQMFDLIIYDLCSIIGFADVNLLAQKTDGVILVTGLGKIQSAAFTEALNKLKFCNTSVIGIALNKLVNKT